MTALALSATAQELIVPTGLSFSHPQVYKAANGSGKINGIKIFKAGTFKDSMGYQRTWEVEHLEQMIFHYSLLRNRGVFKDVPVRDGHPGIFGSGGSVIGYISELTRDGTFLNANLDITEPEAMAKWERGTFRARSLEVGMYETNDEATYWPVVMGVAFVDIPAVEGLHSKVESGKRSLIHFSQVLLDEKETSVGTDDPTGGGNGGTGDQPTPPTPPTPPPDPNNGGGAPAPGSGENPASGEHGKAPAPPAPPAPPAVQAFTINGQPTSDFAAVQAHIASLETFQRETIDQARRDYVTSLVTDKKIAAPQKDALTALALTMSAEQFDAFKQSYEGVGAAPLFGLHGVQSGGSPSGMDAKEQERLDLEEVIAMHRRAGMPQDKIEKLDSFKRLQALKATA